MNEDEWIPPRQMLREYITAQAVAHDGFSLDQLEWHLCKRFCDSLRKAYRMAADVRDAVASLCGEGVIVHGDDGRFHLKAKAEPATGEGEAK